MPFCVLFICGKNQWRSPTAEQVFSAWPGVECRSAGVGHDAEVRVSAELLDWADLVFVMERAHKARLKACAGDAAAGRRIICLDIPDKYRYMDPELVRQLKAKVPRHLPQVAP